MILSHRSSQEVHEFDRAVKMIDDAYRKSVLRQMVDEADELGIYDMPNDDVSDVNKTFASQYNSKGLGNKF